MLCRLPVDKDCGDAEKVREHGSFGDRTILGGGGHSSKEEGLVPIRGQVQRSSLWRVTFSRVGGLAATKRCL